MRTILIDPFRKEVRETDLEANLWSLQAAVGGDIEFAVRIDKHDFLYVADRVWCTERFVVGGTRSFAGFGVVVGVTGDGATAPAKVALDALRRVVRFP